MHAVSCPYYPVSLLSLKREGRCCRSARVIVTASGGMRGSKRVELKEIVDAAAKAAADKGHKVPPLLLRRCVSEIFLIRTPLDESGYIPGMPL